MPVLLGRPEQQRPGFVEERQVGLAPAAARPAEQRLLVRVEDPLRGVACREEPSHDLLGLRRGPGAVEKAGQPAVASQSALDLLEVAIRLAAEPRAVVLVEAAQDVHPEALARSRREAELRARLGEQLADLVRLDTDEAALHPHDELLRLALRGRVDEPPQHLGHARVGLQALCLVRIRDGHLGAVDELGDRALVDAVLAERREHVRDVLHEGRVRPDDEHAP